MLVDYVYEKYGSMSNYYNKLEKMSGNKNIERKKFENILQNTAFIQNTQFLMELCKYLRIDFEQLFTNEIIIAMNTANNISSDEDAEIRYFMLNPEGRQKTLDYMDDILKN